MAAVDVNAPCPEEQPNETGKSASLTSASACKPEGASCNLTKVQEAILRRASSSRHGLGTSTSRLSPAQKAQWQAAVMAVTRQMRGMRYSADHSTFSALNVDGIGLATPRRRTEGRSGSNLISESSASANFVKTRQSDDSRLEAEKERTRREITPQMLKEQSAVPDSEAETTSSEISSKEIIEPIHDEPNLSLREQGRCTSLGLTSTSSGCGDEAQILSEGEEAVRSGSRAGDEESEAASEENKATSELGDFFKSPKGKSFKAHKASKESTPCTPSIPEKPAALSTQPVPEATSCSASAAREPSTASASPSLADIAPADVRAFLLSFRDTAGPVPTALQSLSTQEADDLFVLSLDSHLGARQTSAPSPVHTGLPSRQVSGGLPGRQVSGGLPSRQISSGLPCRQISASSMDSDMPMLARQCSAPVPPSAGLRRDRAMSSRLTPSATAYRVSLGGKSRMEDLRRAVKCSLNKVCPESVITIAAKISLVEVCNAEELQEVISLIFQKALSEPHYCSTYADLVFRIKSAFPEFPTPNNGKPQTFKSLLLDVCQKEFESLPTTLEPSSEDLQQYDAEELEFRRKSTKDRLLANMKLIGHLFLRQMLSPRVIGAVIEELTLCHNDCKDRLPESHCVECAVELLLSIGHTLEALPVGKQAIQQVCGRLLDLKQRKGKDGRGTYCKRIQFAIQDLLDVRAAGWAKKVFGGVAKTKEEIRMEQQRDLLAQARGKEVETGQVIISGQRPEYIEASA